MSTRGLRARLKRVKKMPKPVSVRSDFRIDPAVAKALLDDQRRLDELRRNRLQADPPLGESEEEAMLRARIDARADTIVCPPSYRAWQAREDSGLLGDPEVIANDAKCAQVAARIAAFDRTPEGRVRKRIMELEDKRWESLDPSSPDTFLKLKPHDQSELDDLKTLYPDLAPDPNDFWYPDLIRLQEEEARDRQASEARKRAQEELEARKRAHEDETD
jgi:hypothetical protein